MEKVIKIKCVSMTDFFAFLNKHECNCPLTLYLKQEGKAVIISNDFADVQGEKFKIIKFDPD